MCGAQAVPEPLAIRARKTPRILVVDDHPAVRQGLAMVLEAEGIGECREAGSRAEALDVASRESLDLALVGLSMRRHDTVALVAELHARRILVMVCSQQDGAADVKRAMDAGARAYVTKGEAPQEIARAVRDVLAGWILISPAAADGLGDDGGLDARLPSTLPSTDRLERARHQDEFTSEHLSAVPDPEETGNGGKTDNPQHRRDEE